MSSELAKLTEGNEGRRLITRLELLNLTVTYEEMTEAMIEKAIAEQLTVTVSEDPENDAVLIRWRPSPDGVPKLEVE